MSNDTTSTSIKEQDDDSKTIRVAILYQKAIPPPKSTSTTSNNNDCIAFKPLKEGGYSDSGADIAYALSHLNNNDIKVITPIIDNPNIDNNYDWVFPDTKEGILKAIEMGANTLWLNTVLFSTHPIIEFINTLQKNNTLQNKNTIKIVGQDPNLVEKYDDKFNTNQLLKQHSLSVATSILVTNSSFTLQNNLIININQLNEMILKEKYNLQFPLIIKPIRGRGSEGVCKVNNFIEFINKFNELINTKVIIEENNEISKFGNTLIVEEYLNGEEITITVMPPGKYLFNKNQQLLSTFTNLSNELLNKENNLIEMKDYWTLPPVKRFNHINGVAPYNGVVAVTKNSKLYSITDNNIQEFNYLNEIINDCKIAGKIVNAKAPIRIDCRRNENDKFKIFDLNMKPNMTGPGRNKNREDQDSLTLIAARGIGWNFNDLLINILRQAWN